MLFYTFDKKRRATLGQAYHEARSQPQGVVSSEVIKRMSGVSSFRQKVIRVFRDMPVANTPQKLMMHLAYRR